MFNSFIEALPEKVRSTDDFEYGTRFRKKENALKYRYVEANQFYKKHIILDIDEPGSAYWWEERNLPPPTIIIVNPINSYCHYLYELKTPVYYTENAKRAPQKFYENTDLALTNALDADLDYVGKFVKNPLHPSWLVIKHNATYDLEDFGEYLDLQAHKKKQKLEASLGGRNTTLFDTLRLWAYQEVKQHTFYVSFQDLVDRKAQSINLMFLDSLDGVLPVKEVLSTAKSVGKWTWRHQYSIGNGGKNRGVLGLPGDMPLPQKQIEGAAYTNNTRKKNTLQAILDAAVALKTAGTPITQKSVSIRADVSLDSAKKYWNEVDKQLNLYKKT